MRKRIFYQIEKISPFFTGAICILIVIATAAFIFLTLPDKSNITILTSLIIVIPASIWASVYFIRVYKYTQRRKKFIARRDLLINSGTKYAGRIINSRREVHYSIDSDGHPSPDYIFTAKIYFDKDGNGIKFWTEPLCFSAKSLVCKDVDVYELNGDYLAYNFRDNPKVKINTLKAIREQKLNKNQIIILTSIIVFPFVFFAIIYGVILISILFWR